MGALGIAYIIIAAGFAWFGDAAREHIEARYQGWRRIAAVLLASAICALWPFSVLIYITSPARGGKHG